MQTIFRLFPSFFPSLPPFLPVSLSFFLSLVPSFSSWSLLSPTAYMYSLVLEANYCAKGKLAPSSPFLPLTTELPFLCLISRSNLHKNVIEASFRRFLFVRPLQCCYYCDLQVISDASGWPSATLITYIRFFFIFFSFSSLLRDILRWFDTYLDFACKRPLSLSFLLRDPFLYHLHTLPSAITRKRDKTCRIFLFLSLT